MFGAGVFSTERFLYEAVGALYWLRWSANEGTALTVHDEASEALAEEARCSNRRGGVDADADADAGGERVGSTRRRAPPTPGGTRGASQQHRGAL